MSLTTTTTTTTTTTVLLLLILLTTTATTTTAITQTTISTAAEILSNTNHHNAMSLILPLISSSLNLSSLPSATLFSPSDAAFSSAVYGGQPSLDVLRRHFSPHLYTSSDLLSLPFGHPLPTLLNSSYSSLSVSSTVFDDFFSLNGVKINLSSPVFLNSSSFSVFSVDEFFPASPPVPPTNTVSELPLPPTCHVAPPGGAYWDASAALRSRGYSLMAGFLDVQVNQFIDPAEEGSKPVVITVFAPKDEAVRGYFGNFNDWGSIFLRHVVGCEMSFGELNSLNDGVVLGTFLKGFGIKIEKNYSSAGGNGNGNGNLWLNQNFTVDFPDFYRGEKILVHGVSGYFTVPPPVDDDGTPADQGGVQGDGSYSDHGEF